MHISVLCLINNRISCGEVQNYSLIIPIFVSLITLFINLHVDNITQMKTIAGIATQCQLWFFT